MAPTVEGSVLAAIRRAWGDVVLSLARSTRTEKGCHAAENVLVVSVRARGPRDDADLRRELEGSEICLLAPAGLVAVPALFDKIHAAKKRAFRVYLPYWALLRVSELVTATGSSLDPVARAVDPPSGRLGGRDGEGVWLCNVPIRGSEREVAADIRESVAQCGMEVALSEIEVDLASQHALVHMSKDAASQLCPRLEAHSAGVLKAIPLSEARVKLALHKLTRPALKALRGPAKGQRNFHNFMPDGIGWSEPSALRQLQKCGGASLVDDVRGPAGSSGGQPSSDSWIETDWTSFSFSAVDFAPQQLRRMAGAVVTVMRGAEDLDYIRRCFEESPVTTIAAPAEAVCLDSVTFQWDTDWRSPVGFDEDAARRLREEISQRVVREALQPWKEVVARIDAGATRGQWNTKLHAAASAGCSDEMIAALNSGAGVNAVDEYGRSAVFLAAQAGHEEIIRALMHRRVDLDRPANGGTTPHAAAAAAGHTAVLWALQSLGARCAEGEAERYSVEPIAKSNPVTVTVLIPESLPHAGAGTLTIDGAFNECFLERLGTLWQKLPLAAKEKASPTERAYYADAEGWVTRCLDSAVVAAGLRGFSLPLMRFLIYPTAGGSLPPHVDLPRTTSKGIRSTHTFLLYLTDCAQGGETRFLQAFPGDAALAASGGLAPGERDVVAAAVPRKGRLLLMPHACPHEAAPIVDAPKVLVRGELCMT